MRSLSPTKAAHPRVGVEAEAAVGMEDVAVRRGGAEMAMSGRANRDHGVGDQLRAEAEVGLSRK